MHLRNTGPVSYHVRDVTGGHIVGNKTDGLDLIFALWLSLYKRQDYVLSCD